MNLEESLFLMETLAAKLPSPPSPLQSFTSEALTWKFT